MEGFGRVIWSIEGRKDSQGRRRKCEERAKWISEIERERALQSPLRASVGSFSIFECSISALRISVFKGIKNSERKAFKGSAESRSSARARL